MFHLRLPGWLAGVLLAAAATSTIAGGPVQIVADETWTSADSPVVITADTTIVPGVTVTVDPGVVVELRQGARLFVEGSLVGTGTPASPIRFEGGTTSFVYMEVPGSLALAHASFDFQIRPRMSGSVEISDATFGPGAVLSNVGSGYYLSLERCTFDGSYLWLGGGTIRLAQTQVNGNFISLGGSFVHLDDVTVTDAPQWSLRLAGFEQPVYIDDVAATGSAGGGLELVAGNYFIGSNVQLSGNEHTALLAGAGILPGSTLPAGGNLNNYIKVESQSFGSWSNVWADAGIPYAMTGGQYHSGALEILPGVTVLLEPDFTWWDDEGAVDARGTPTAPVRFERLVPGESWQGLQYFHRFENCIIDGGQVGARFSSWTTGGYIDNCVIRNNDFGTQNASTVRKTRFVDNAVGVWDNGVDGALESTTSPNSFVGNGLAVDYVDSLIDARHAWWGDPSGPTTTSTPAGQATRSTSASRPCPS